MQNTALLKELGLTGKPILLKRGMNNTLMEWLNSAEYILSEGNPNVVLCERGLRTIETYTRNTLDLSIIPSVKEVTHLPVIADISPKKARQCSTSQKWTVTGSARHSGWEQHEMGNIPSFHAKNLLS